MVDEDVPCEDVLAQITLPAEQKKADVGIAMGGVGSDIALVDDEVKELPHLIALSRRMMITIKCNFFVKKQQKQNICLYFGTLYGIVK